MNQEFEDKIKKRVLVIELILVLAVIAYIGITVYLKIFPILALQIVLVSFLIAFLLVDTVLQPYWLGQLKDLQSEKKLSYLKMILFSVAGTICLSVFIFSIGDEATNGYSSVGFYFAIGFIFLNRLKHKERRKFLGIEEDEIEQTEDDLTQTEDDLEQPKKDSTFED